MNDLLIGVTLFMLALGVMIGAVGAIAVKMHGKGKQNDITSKEAQQDGTVVVSGSEEITELFIELAKRCNCEKCKELLSEGGQDLAAIATELTETAEFAVDPRLKERLRGELLEEFKWKNC